MILPLRKRHLFTWATLAVLLPVGFVSAYLVIPKPVADRVEYFGQATPLEKVLGTGDDEFFLVNYRSSIDDSIKQVEIVIKKPLSKPFALAYLSVIPEPATVEGLMLLGKLGSKGVYRFNLNQPVIISGNFYIVFFDFIKKEKFHSLKIQ